MKRVICFIYSCFMLTGCLPCCPTMDLCDYSTIYEGESIERVVQCHGKPFRVRSCEDGVREYVYIERHEMTLDTDRYRYFVIRVVDGCVVGKDVCDREYFELFDARGGRVWGGAVH